MLELEVNHNYIILFTNLSSNFFSNSHFVCSNIVHEHIESPHVLNSRENTINIHMLMCKNI